MNILNEIIALMNKEQIRSFKLYANRMDIKGERKDLALFDYIRQSSDDYNDDKIAEKLYSTNKNAFYRLKNRLLDDLSKVMLLNNFDEVSATQCMWWLSLSVVYSRKNKMEIAHYFLHKAEKKALETEDFQLLDVIYNEYIKNCIRHTAIDPAPYIVKHQNNAAKLNKIREIEHLMAVISYRVKVTQNFSLSNTEIFTTLENTINQFIADPELKDSRQFQFRIYRAVTNILLQKHDYQTLLPYLLNTYEQFTQKEFLKNKGQHGVKLEMFTYIINCLFKTDRYQESLEYAEKLKEAMLEHDAFLYDKYLLFYYNSLVINYSELNKPKAISILEGLDSKTLLEKNPYYAQFIFLNLAVLYFDTKQYDKATKAIIKLPLQDSFKQADESFRMKIGIAELIIRYQDGDLEVLDYKIEQTKRDFRKLLREPENKRETELLKLLKAMLKSFNIKKDDKVKRQIKAFIEQGRSEEETDKEIIKYNDWLNMLI
ncbi:MAG: hypothetical protein KA168_04285 [Chitinophagales bacterium]|nr:hypothetical protein [Chitinophagales bacterium]